jgi:Ricin-type beta-trefoil lectin domain
MRLSALALLTSLSSFTVAACLDPQDSSQDPSESTQVSALGNFPDLSPNQVEVTSANGGGCMDLPLGLPAGAPLWLQQFPCNGGGNQRLKFESLGNGTYRVHSAYNESLCLDIPSGNTVAGQDLQFFGCHSGANQIWTVSALNASFGTIHPLANSSLCLDVENASTGVAKIQLYGCGSPIATNRQWRFRTYLGTRSMPGCTGNVTIGGTTVIPGAVASFSVPGGVLTGACNSVSRTTFQVDCPATTNWMVANRNTANAGTANFPLACFRQ